MKAGETLKALAAPYGGKFTPIGGVNSKNPADYLSLPAVHACGGSCMVTSELISAGKFAETTRLAEEAWAIVRQVREEQ